MDSGTRPAGSDHSYQRFDRRRNLLRVSIGYELYVHLVTELTSGYLQSQICTVESMLDWSLHFDRGL